MSLQTRITALVQAIGADIKALYSGKVGTDDARLTDAREWSATTVSQAEAEAGIATTRRAWTAQRVAQAIAAWWAASAMKTKLDGIQAGAQVNVATNLAQGTRTGTAVPITSSTGTNATLGAATTSLAGVMAAADKTKLDGVASGATANASDAQLRDRSSHTGTQSASTITGLGTAATANVQASPTDTTAGALMGVGAFGLGGRFSGLEVADLNTLPDTHPYTGYFPGIATGSSVNAPVTGSRLWYVHQHIYIGGTVTQTLYAYRTDVDGEWIRSRFSGSWTPWRRKYDQASILGTVSQSGGVPTGAMFERVANASGEYLRLPDGTQICWGTGTGTPNASDTNAFGTTSGTTFFENVSVPLPAAFVTTNYALIPVATTRGIATIGAASSASTGLVQCRHTIQGTSVPFRYIAIGRWYN